MSSDTESDNDISNDESDTMEVDCITLRKSGSKGNDITRCKLVPELNLVLRSPVKSDGGFGEPFDSAKSGNVLMKANSCVSAPAELKLEDCEGNAQIKRLLSAISDVL